MTTNYSLSNQTQSDRIWKSLRNGKEGTKEWWLDGWEDVFDAEYPMPVDIWERAKKVYQLVESSEPTGDG